MQIKLNENNYRYKWTKCKHDESLFENKQLKNLRIPLNIFIDCVYLYLQTSMNQIELPHKLKTVSRKSIAK